MTVAIRTSGQLLSESMASYVGIPTEINDIQKYVQLVSDSVKASGFLIISTFSKNGPDKCSGLPISKYSHEELIELFSARFKNVTFSYETHETPWSSTQEFVYCVFTKKA